MNSICPFNLKGKKREKKLLKKLQFSKNVRFEVLNPTVEIFILGELEDKTKLLKKLESQLDNNNNEIKSLNSQLNKINSSKDLFIFYTNTENDLPINEDLKKG